ncbi:MULTISPECIES: hypothetical protein [Streptomyces]|uniref:hypothetical protein n=1 Tax=Streptomyces TaxID=1883 RepID=UPI00142E6753|nr:MULTISPECIES: hypothetical protein [Streptomyces]
MNVQIVPDDHDGVAEPEVGPDEKVAVVLPGEASMITPVMALAVVSQLAVAA